MAFSLLEVAQPISLITVRVTMVWMIPSSRLQTYALIDSDIGDKLERTHLVDENHKTT